MNTDPRQGWYTGQFVGANKALPPGEVDGSEWEADVPADQWFRGQFVPSGPSLPAGEVDGSAWDVAPAVWLELVVTFEPHTPPGQVMGHVNRLLAVLDAAAPDLGLAYDVHRSRSEGEQVILALTPRNPSGVEQRLRDILAAVNPELSRLAGPNPTVARLARGADAA
jgi:hypothetical protein